MLNSFYSKFILRQINKISVLETFPPSLESHCTHKFAMNVVTVLSSSVQDLSCRNLCRVHFLVQHKGRLGTTWKCPVALLLNWHRNLTAPVFRCGLKCPLIFPDGNLFPSGSLCPGVKIMSHKLPETSQALHQPADMIKTSYAFPCKVTTFAKHAWRMQGKPDMQSQADPGTAFRLQSDGILPWRNFSWFTWFSTLLTLVRGN